MARSSPTECDGSESELESGGLSCDAAALNFATLPKDAICVRSFGNLPPLALVASLRVTLTSHSASLFSPPAQSDENGGCARNGILSEGDYLSKVILGPREEGRSIV